MLALVKFISKIVFGVAVGKLVGGEVFAVYKASPLTICKPAIYPPNAADPAVSPAAILAFPPAYIYVSWPVATIFPFRNIFTSVAALPCQTHAT